MPKSASSERTRPVCATSCIAIDSRDLEVERGGVEPGLLDDPPHVRRRSPAAETGAARRSRTRGALGAPRTCQDRSCSHARRRTHSPTRAMRPTSSASGMNSRGDRMPFSGWRQRTSASTPTTDARREAEDRLVVEDELAAGQRAPEPGLEGGALLRLLLHLPREELEAVAARLLRAVHRGVHVRHERLGVLRRRRGRGRSRSTPR